MPAVAKLKRENELWRELYVMKDFQKKIKKNRNSRRRNAAVGDASRSEAKKEKTEKGKANGYLQTAGNKG